MISSLYACDEATEVPETCTGAHNECANEARHEATTKSCIVTDASCSQDWLITPPMSAHLQQLFDDLFGADDDRNCLVAVAGVTVSKALIPPEPFLAAQPIEVDEVPGLNRCKAWLSASQQVRLLMEPG